MTFNVLEVAVFMLKGVNRVDGDWKEKSGDDGWEGCAEGRAVETMGSWLSLVGMGSRLPRLLILMWDRRSVSSDRVIEEMLWVRIICSRSLIVSSSTLSIFMPLSPSSRSSMSSCLDICRYLSYCSDLLYQVILETLFVFKNR